jgi:hypothetical protein
LPHDFFYEDGEAEEVVEDQEVANSEEDLRRAEEEEAAEKLELLKRYKAMVVHIPMCEVRLI